MFVLGVAVLGVTLLAVPGSAIRSDPGKAKKFQGSLVSAYVECTAPNTTTVGVGLAACQPADLVDDVCSIQADGGGKLQAKADTKVGDLKVKAKLKGIANCEGETLCVVASVRVTTNNCTAGPDCTVVDLNDFPLVGGPIPACCTVDKGKCNIKTTLNSALPVPALALGQNTSFEVDGCGLTRTTGTSSPARLARCGVLVP